MDNERIAQVLESIGQVLELRDENPFRVRAYYNAARQVRGLARPAADLVKQGDLNGIPGIGKDLREKISELVDTGRLAYWESLREEIPAGLLDMLRIPGMGPKKVKAVWKELGVESIAALEKACRRGLVAGLKGFGDRSQAKILQGVCFMAGHAGRFRLGDALPMAQGLLRYIEESGLTKAASLAGSLRRGKPVVQDIDLLAASDKPGRLMEHFLRAPDIAETLASGPTKTSVRLASGIQVDLRVVEPKQFPYALLYFTGSKEHNVALRARAQRMGLKVSEYGIFKGARLLAAKSERDCYKLLGLGMIEPELRENTGEIEAAEKGELPDLVELSDLQGVFHVHSDWSDGTAKIEEMAEKARAMGLKYMGLSDHSQAASYAKGLSERRLREQARVIDGLNARWKDFRILKGLECDILSDGEMDLTPAALSALDFVIGSVHSHFTMGEEEMTRRVCAALGDKNMDILGHPTGRLLLSREGYKIDLEKVLAEAKKRGKTVEINSHPQRLDLDWTMARRAGELGVRLSINPDAHAIQGLEDIRYGVIMARRAWLSKKQILNARPWPEASRLLRSAHVV